MSKLSTSPLHKQLDRDAIKIRNQAKKIKEENDILSKKLFNFQTGQGQKNYIKEKHDETLNLVTNMTEQNLKLKDELQSLKNIEKYQIKGMK
mmetsp:Transcript_17619/g.15533  ORF Transcript_17619/g.15533 Transcript_17619/m.15533 type:complete len:92 (-) Transcript_17619:837-1112(-)